MVRIVLEFVIGQCVTQYISSVCEILPHFDTLSFRTVTLIYKVIDQSSIMNQPYDFHDDFYRHKIIEQ